MSDIKSNQEKAKTEIHDGGTSKATANPLLTEASIELSSAPKTYQEKAIQYVENEHDDRRKNLPPEKIEAVRAIESLIVNADSKGLTDYIHTLADKPAQYEDAMNAVVLDLMSVGVRASWNYSPFKDRNQPYDPGAPKEIGNFTLETPHPVGTTTVRYSTQGDPVVHSTESEFRNNNVNMNDLARAGLRQSANIWLKRVMD